MHGMRPREAGVHEVQASGETIPVPGGDLKHSLTVPTPPLVDVATDLADLVVVATGGQQLGHNGGCQTVPSMPSLDVSPAQGVPEWGGREGRHGGGRRASVALL